MVFMITKVRGPQKNRVLKTKKAPMTGLEKNETKNRKTTWTHRFVTGAKTSRGQKTPGTRKEKVGTSY